MWCIVAQTLIYTVNLGFFRLDFNVVLCGCAHHTGADVYETVGLVKVAPFSCSSDLDGFSSHDASDLYGLPYPTRRIQNMLSFAFHYKIPLGNPGVCSNIFLAF